MGAYADPSLLLFNRQGALVARSFDIENGVLTGEAVTIASTVSFDAPFNLGGFSVAGNGSIAYRAGEVERRQMTWFNRSGNKLGVVGDVDINTLVGLDLSPDGRLAAVTRTVQNNVDVWLYDVLRGGATRFTFDTANDSTPMWSFDGAQVAFISNRKGIYDIYLKPASGTGDEQLLVESPYVKAPMSWSPDSKFFFFASVDPRTGWDIWVLPLDGDRKATPFATTAFEERNGQLSPDARWLAYQSNESGRLRFTRSPFRDPEANGKSRRQAAHFRAGGLTGRNCFSLPLTGN
ncbi:MAG: PD40 domain-containing protein [Acidobacteria bacterium]|nr:PD40 domain-containing protein [Acidobacteriota bacterium]